MEPHSHSLPGQGTKSTAPFSHLGSPTEHTITFQLESLVLIRILDQNLSEVHGLSVRTSVPNITDAEMVFVCDGYIFLAFLFS